MASITKDANGKIIKQNVSIISTTPVSYPTVGLGAVDNNYNGNINSLNLNGTNVVVSGTQLNYTNVTPGTVSPSKAIVLDSNSSISNLNSVSCSTITINGVVINGSIGGVESTAYLTNNIEGRAVASKSLILDSNSNITNLNSVSTNTISLGKNNLITNGKKNSYNINNYVVNSLTNTNQWNSMCWSPSLNLFVAVSSTGTGNRVMTSTDGTNWTLRTSASDNNWNSVCWSAKLYLFVAVASSGTGNRVMTSSDGISWTNQTSVADNNWTSVCWSAPLLLLVAVASSGTGNRVMTSVDGINWSPFGQRYPPFFTVASNKNGYIVATYIPSESSYYSVTSNVSNFNSTYRNFNSIGFAPVTIVSDSTGRFVVVGYNSNSFPMYSTSYSVLY
jgi:hypothetical protein